MRSALALPALFLLSAFAHADEQSRTTPAFNAINGKLPCRWQTCDKGSREGIGLGVPETDQ